MSDRTQVAPFDGTAVVLHLIEAAREWARVQGAGLRPEAVALVAWVSELEERYEREKVAPAPVGWEPRQWRELLPGDTVSLGGAEAVIAAPAVTQHWHVDTRNEVRKWHTGPDEDHCRTCQQRCRRARGWESPALEHSVTLIRLEGREQAYRMPPDGEVETLRGEAGREADAASGYRSPLAEDGPDVLTEWAWEAVQTLQAAGLKPVEVK